MLASEQFKMRISPQDKAMLVSIAKHLHRSQSDTVKTLVREVYAAIKADQVGDGKSVDPEQRSA